MPSDKRFVVVQIGGRRGYAVPTVLERAGILERFYTEICGNTGAGRFLAMARHLPGTPSSVAHLAARRLPDPIAGKTRTFAWPAVRHAWRARPGALKDEAAAFEEHLRFSRELGEAMVRAGFGAATHVYGMMGECGPFLAEASRRGLIVVSDVYILLSTERILEAERRAFPDWEPEAPDFAAIRRRVGQEDALLRWTDHFLCPISAVQNDLVDNFGIARERTSIVPYPVEPRWFEVSPAPVRGRVLFAGAAGLRKGIHYLAMASERLVAHNRAIEFRIAGEVSRQVAEKPLCRHLTFLGRVARGRLPREFATADVFVLPTLAEGLPAVQLEAMASGVPAVVTPACGSIVRDGIEGRIVPERDPVALADAIAEIIEDRDKRARMSEAARQRARAFTWDRYGARLVAALQDLGDPPGNDPEADDMPLAGRFGADAVEAVGP